MNALLKFILFFAVIIFIIRAVAKTVFSIFSPNNQQSFKQKPQRREGEVRLENNATKSRFSKEEGEYVDFEEID